MDNGSELSYVNSNIFLNHSVRPECMSRVQVYIHVCQHSSFFIMTFTLRLFNPIARGGIICICPNTEQVKRFVSTTAPRLSAAPQKLCFSNPPFNLFTKSRIADIFARYCPNLDPQPFHVAAQVYPMRVNNYVLENLIDWSVLGWKAYHWSCRRVQC